MRISAFLLEVHYLFYSELYHLDIVPKVGYNNVEVISRWII